MYFVKCRRDSVQTAAQEGSNIPTLNQSTFDSFPSDNGWQTPPEVRAAPKALLGSEAHAEAGQVSVGEGEEDHEEDVPGVVSERHGEVFPRMDVAQHEERDEDDSDATQDRKPDAVLTRLDTHRDGQHGTGQDFKYTEYWVVTEG